MIDNYTDARGRPLIAVVGMAGRFPGASDLDEFWGHVISGRDCSSDVPAGRWQIPAEQAVDLEVGRFDHVPHGRGYFLDAIPCHRDDDRGLDASVHLAVDIVTRAWHTAVTSFLDPARCGVVLGHIALPTDSVSQLARELLGFEVVRTDRMNRLVAGLPVFRAAQAIGARGEVLGLDAACASGLYAVKLAVDALQAGRADAMVAGGLSRPDCLYTQMGFAQLRALSRSGRCSPFDVAADGLVVGEGGGAVVLKRLDDAERDGDVIQAVIAGIGLSNDREGNVLAPASEGQLRALRAAHDRAGWAPGTAPYVECHATGTPVGDAVELESLRTLYGSNPCVLGAVKSTVGHLLTGAGAAGLIKTILALRNGVMPPTANFRTPAEGLVAPMRVLRDAEEWRGPRRAGVSGFGFGGINAHVLVEQYEPRPRGVAVSVRPSPRAIAVVGIGVRLGDEQGVDQFTRRCVSILPHLGRVDEFAVPLGRFPIPPNEFAAMMPQQAMLLLAAGDALSDLRHPIDPVRTGVFLAAELDWHTTDFHVRWSRPSAERDGVAPPLTPEAVLGHLASVTASRVARTMGAGGPSFVLNSGVDSSTAALRVAIDQITQGEIDYAVVGTADTPSDPRDRGCHEIAEPIDSAVTWVIMPEDMARAAGHRIYGLVSLPSTDCANEFVEAGQAGSMLTATRELLRRHHGLDGDIADGDQPIGYDGPIVAIDPPSWPAVENVDGPLGRVAFVFPGSGNDSVGMGRELARAFPGALRRQAGENTTLRRQYALDEYWGEGGATPCQALMAQVAFGTLVCDILAAFGVRPDVAVGNSLGVSASFFGLRAWTDRDAMLRRLDASPLFRSELAGPCDAARRAWQIPEGASAEWRCALAVADESEIRQRLGRFRGCAVLAVNAPGECVVGGPACYFEPLLAAADWPLVPLSNVTAAHCEVIAEVAREYRELHSLPTTAPEGVEFWHPVLHRPMPLTRESAADAVLQQALNPINFPQFVNALYAAGVRTFVEVGPGASCTRMIASILAGKPHRAIAAAAHQAGEVAGLMHTLATLEAAGYPVDHSPLRGFPVAMPPERCVTVARRRVPRQVGQSEPSSLFARVATAQMAVARAHAAYLQFARGIDRCVAEFLVPPTPRAVERSVFLDREQCMEFAIGRIAPVLGPSYAQVDSFPTRVRLPDEPLMLVDRIVSVEGEPHSLTQGRVVTEHDVTADRWYLDDGRMPTCIAVESGQADLFLAGYLGIDEPTRGRAVYRLLDAVVMFHRGLPVPGEIISYDIHIDRFFRQGETHLFRFRFEGTIAGQPLLSMKEGCAGFFTAEELAAGQGIVQTTLDRRPDPRPLPADWIELAPVPDVETYDDGRLDRLREGDLSGGFGSTFDRLSLADPIRLPGGKLRLVHRIKSLDPRGGRFGLGLIRGEADVRPDDWYLTCHFVDDMVMPGTLMYECCMHTLRVFLMRLGWVGERGRVAWEPIPGVASKLKCRGQVTTSTRLVTYEVAIKELGYRPEPYAIADVLMYADGKPIVEIANMSIRLTGTTREELVALWSDAAPLPQKRPALYDSASILAFAVGKPSEAFGDRYRPFDSERVIARLPGPPYMFLDRIAAVDGAPWVVRAGTEVEAEYDVPADAWYFDAYRRPMMPFAVLLEVALQPCGWLAAYMGSALTSEVDLSFRNLGGTATQHRSVTPRTGTLTTRVKSTSVSTAGGMLIQHYSFEMRDSAGRPVYDGTTYFGFFSKSALANQVGIRDFAPPTEPRPGEPFAYPTGSPYPDQRWRMVDTVRQFVPDGGPAGLGFARGTKPVDPREWFFAAHFHQDPVMPGSLGLEAFLQLADILASQRWGASPNRQIVALGTTHSWQYRGQVIPGDQEVTIQAEASKIDQSGRRLWVNGSLAVDGRVIYRMTDFALEG